MAEKTASKKIDTITIPLAEYVYLTRVDALMDVILNDDYYNTSGAVRAVVDTARKMRGEAVAAE